MTANHSGALVGVQAAVPHRIVLCFPDWDRFHMNIDVLENALRKYGGLDMCKADADCFREFLLSAPHVFERSHLPGHFTGSAWLVSADGARVLLMHHRKLGLWLQPGGHADGDADIARVALREAQEETGVADLRVEGGIFDIDRHRIPARADEPEHWHYDVRYVVRAGEDERFTINVESQALAWHPVAELVNDISFDSSLRRMAHKWLARDGLIV
jgi:8-oxo-dGTP pyrophosphatase MutT (NUDIX family)